MQDAEREFHRSLTPEERMQVLFALIEYGKKPEERNQKIAKIYRIRKLEELRNEPDWA